MARRRRSGFDDGAGRTRGHWRFGGAMRVSALIGAFVLAGCATASSLTPPQRLAGCWINRDAGASRMRWNENAGGALTGVKTTFGIAGMNTTERYALSA